MAVGGTGVAVGGNGVDVGGNGVAVGGTGVDVAGGDEHPIAINASKPTINDALIKREGRTLGRLFKVNSCSSGWSSTKR